MYRKQFRLTVKEENALKDINLFACLLYSKALDFLPICTDSAVSAPANDLNFIKSGLYAQLLHNKKEYPQQQQMHLEDICGTVLEQRIYSIGFSDPNTDIQMKKLIVEALNKRRSDKLPRLDQVDLSSFNSQ